MFSLLALELAALLLGLRVPSRNITTQVASSLVLILYLPLSLYHEIISFFNRRGAFSLFLQISMIPMLANPISLKG